MPYINTLSHWLDFPSQTGGTIVSPPIAQSRIKLLTANDYNHTTVGIFPQMGMGRIAGGNVAAFITGQGGAGAHTVELFLDGAATIYDVQTMATLPVTFSQTSIVVLDASQFAIGDYILTYDLQSTINAPTVGNQVNAVQEWMKITNIASNTLTVSRGKFGTTAVGFNNPPTFFKTNSWTPISTGNSATPFMDSGAISLSGSESVTAPQVIQLDMLALGMDSIPHNFVRARLVNSTGDTCTGWLTATFDIASETQSTILG